MGRNMTDAEINLAIAKIEWGDDFLDDDYLASLYECVDYVYNWSDMGPIIERENMFIAPIYDGWEASSIECDVPVTAESPTKAAALCYLKMKGVEL
jgi:hypothetical protein